MSHKPLSLSLSLSPFKCGSLQLRRWRLRADGGPVVASSLRLHGHRLPSGCHSDSGHPIIDAARRGGVVIAVVMPPLSATAPLEQSHVLAGWWGGARRAGRRGRSDDGRKGNRKDENMAANAGSRPPLATQDLFL